ncbi:fimbrial protein BcfE [Serratia odorifera]|uniref:Fimbrial protein n=3 Tax=Serratia odorifera TaxID=618 RepID=D4E076_SEROD|nr:fimbrial protein [Serratia odorifera]EFE96717.1 fimbrial protein [Serratia odorifera DSM 4582]PNK91339.1 type 1 fimbrial protein [Serratia odorifera]RII72573.1 type 1 fimbrial protein [Serratia odorifera]VDZ56134.1 fimbrial protein BcfE [Serratia odorifera]
MLHLIIVALLGYACLLYGAAMAAEINISGVVVANTCMVDAASLDVDLGDVPLAALQSAGAAGPLKEFALKVINCPVSFNGRSVYARFKGTADPDSPRLYINNGTATGVAVELMTEAGGVLLRPSGVTYYAGNIKNQQASWPLSARMVASTGNAMPGSVKAVALVNFVYH